MVKTSETNFVVDVVTETQKYLEKYAAFPDKGYAFASALWAVFTHIWPEFDTVPYLVITSYTKGSGKTLVSELVSFAGANSENAGSVSASAMWSLITEVKPVFYIDQAEYLTGNIDASEIGKALLSGYRRGAKVFRKKGDEVVTFETYSPKCFVLIGDISDALRDRSIVITMRREGTDKYLRSSYTQRKQEGDMLRARVSDVVKENKGAIVDAMLNFKGADYLPARDEEIWSPLFAIAQVFCPNRIAELKRVAVDLATEKTQDMRSFIELRKTKEEKAMLREYSERLLCDMYAVINKFGVRAGRDKGLPTNELIARLKDIDVAPWRKYKGDGLTPDEIGKLLDYFSIEGHTGGGSNQSGATPQYKVSSKVIRFGSGRKDSKVGRGYLKSDIVEAAKKAGVNLV